jgi:hypothetical protein
MRRITTSPLLKQKTMEWPGALRVQAARHAMARVPQVIEVDARRQRLLPLNARTLRVFSQLLEGAFNQCPVLPSGLAAEPCSRKLQQRSHILARRRLDDQAPHFAGVVPRLSSSSSAFDFGF